MLSKISKCQGLAACAEEYAHRLVVDDEMDQGRYWLKEKEDFWSFMKRSHYQVLMEFGLDRDVQLPLIGTPGARTQGSPFQGTPGQRDILCPEIVSQRHQWQPALAESPPLWQVSNGSIPQTFLSQYLLWHGLQQL